MFAINAYFWGGYKDYTIFQFSIFQYKKRGTDIKQLKLQGLRITKRALIFVLTFLVKVTCI